MKIAYFFALVLANSFLQAVLFPTISVSSITERCVGRCRKRGLAEALGTSLKLVFALSKGERRSDCHPQLIPGHVPTQSDIQTKRQELLVSSQSFHFALPLPSYSLPSMHVAA